jgi:predicted N-acetyltransferase YhbS
LPQLALVAAEGRRIVGTVRLWAVSAGPNCQALLLGPLAVHPDRRRRGIGSALVQRALRDASQLGHDAVLLVGDAAYYARFGFSSEKTGELRLHRLLAVELELGALDNARGLLLAGGQAEATPDLTSLVAGLERSEPVLVPHAA